jgi:hypothetical protein
MGGAERQHIGARGGGGGTSEGGKRREEDRNQGRKRSVHTRDHKASSKDPTDMNWAGRQLLLIAACSSHHKMRFLLQRGSVKFQYRDDTQK